MQAPNPGQGSTGSNNRPSGLSWSSPSTASSPSSFNNKQPSLLSSVPSNVKPAATPVSAAARPTVTTSSARTSAARERSGGRSVALFISGVIVGLLVSWGWGATQTQPTNTANNTTPTNTNTGGNSTIGQITSPVIGGAVGASPTQTWGKSGTTPASNIQVQSQPAGMTVRITDATVAQPTWLVVYELANGKPVRALGATMFFPQYNGKGGAISLLRATQPKTTYFVGQSLDTGNHTFVPHTNKEIVDDSGNMIGVLFTTQ